MILENEKIIREYYKTAELWIPPNNPSWRHYRFFKFDGSVLPIHDRVTSVEKLRALLVKHAPAHVFYSCSFFLNPTVLGKRDEVISRNHFMGTDAMYYDIDKVTLYEAKLEALKLHHEICNHTEFKKNKVKTVYSGSKGYHIYDYSYKNVVSPQDPRLWEELTKQKKRDIVDRLSKKVCFDSEVSYNTRAIIRLPSSIHGNTGTLVEFVDIANILQHKPNQVVNLITRPSPVKLNDDIKRLENALILAR